jgi:hypothetical protein
MLHRSDKPKSEILSDQSYILIGGFHTGLIGKQVSPSPDHALGKRGKAETSTLDHCH